jgi:hypothetical protein
MSAGGRWCYSDAGDIVSEIVVDGVKKDHAPLEQAQHGNIERGYLAYGFEERCDKLRSPYVRNVTGKTMKRRFRNGNRPWMPANVLSWLNF